MGRDEVFRLSYQNYFDSESYVEDWFERVRHCSSYLILRRLLGDENIDRFYKMCLLPAVLRNSLFYRVVAHLRSLEKIMLVIPTEDPIGPLHPYFLSNDDFSRLVPRQAIAWPVVIRWVRNIALWNLAVSILVSLQYILWLVITRGVVRRINPVRAEVVIPLMWGFKEDNLIDGQKVDLDDAYILSHSLNSDRVAFFFTRLWSFSKAQERIHITELEKRSLRYFDERELVPDWSYLRQALNFCMQFWGYLARKLSFYIEPTCIVWFSARLVRWYLQELLFARSVENKVMVEYQDYAPHHIIRTIVANQFGRQTVGMHHGALQGPYGLPAIRYAHINHLGVWGNAISRLHGKHWENMRLHPIGAYRVDFVIAAQRQDRLIELQARYKKLYGNTRPLIIMLFPSLYEWNLIHLIQESLEGLRLLKGLEGEFKVVCRFRTREIANAYENMGLTEIMSHDSRIIVDLNQFSTHEWFALSDVVIASSVSTGLVEAAAAGKPCFSFDHRRLAEIVFSCYGRDFVLKTRHDLVRLVKSVTTGSWDLDCRWEQFGRDYSYFADGDNIRRYRQVILDAVQEVTQQQQLC
jgi:hypothetical protein